MNILVIGGSYFFGRWFVQLAHKTHNITVLNRGTIPINLPGVKEIVCDRHDVSHNINYNITSNINSNINLEGLMEKYDTIVDFCAYNAGDIKQIIEKFGSKGARYFYISTVDVYEPGIEIKPCTTTKPCITSKTSITEDTPFKSTFPEGPEGEYISGKVSLEYELRQECDKHGLKGISIRPAILYGPANYAPRESVYFDWLAQAGQIYSPSDATGYFQMIFVGDAVRGLIKLIETDTDDLQDAYNFCTSEVLDYSGFEDELAKAIGVDMIDKVKASVEEILKADIPLPFPLTESESQVYSGDRFESLGVPKTSLAEGLRKCYSIR